jgi:outer membrane protein OmpA-like peptidoglycan-associated protein
MANISANAQIHEYPLGRLLVLVILTVCFGILTSNATGQDYTVSDKKAIRSFDNAMNAFDARNYELALALLEEALDREKNFIEAHLLTFETCTEMRDYDCAEKALKKAVAINGDFFPNAWFFLAALELQRGAYADARMHFERFSTYPRINPEMKEKAEKEIANCAFALEQLKNPVNFEPVNLGDQVNSPFPEYYPTLTADDRQLIFTRLINDPEAFRGKNENFFLTVRDAGTWSPAHPMDDINTVLNEGAPAISGDGRTLIFTACELMGEYGKRRKGYGSCDLFMSEKIGRRWSAPVNLGPEINTSAWESQPSVSADGQTLYFVRGYPTSSGNREQDIYVAKRGAEGEWGGAVKLPYTINTRDKEESVHIHPDGRTLYFSSNGHLGMGGLDIYVSRMNKEGKWSKPVNLGYPINTHKDENSLLVSPNGKVAYFASDREGGFGKLDLYHFELPAEVRPTAVTYARGIVVDADTEEPVVATLRLSNVSTQETQSVSNSDPVTGEFLIALPAGETYGLSVSAEGYVFHSEQFTLSKDADNKPYDLVVKLRKITEGTAIVLRNIFFDLDKDQLKIESLPELRELAGFLDENPEVKIEIAGHTDDQGTDEYNVDLSRRRADAVKKYLVDQAGVASERLVTKGFGASKPIASNDTEEGRAQNRRTEFTVISTE